MNSYLKMKFGTLSGNDLTLTVSNARENLTSPEVSDAMSKILAEDAISGNHISLTSVKEATMYKVTTKTFDFND